MQGVYKCACVYVYMCVVVVAGAEGGGGGGWNSSYLLLADRLNNDLLYSKKWNEMTRRETKDEMRG